MVSLVPMPPSDARPPAKFSETESLVLLGLARSEAEAEARLVKARAVEQRRLEAQRNAMELERLHLEQMKQDAVNRAKRRKQLLRKLALAAQTKEAVKQKAAKERQQARYGRAKLLHTEEEEQLQEDKKTMFVRLSEQEQALEVERKRRSADLRQKARFKQKEQKQRAQALAESRQVQHEELVQTVREKDEMAKAMEVRRQAAMEEYKEYKQREFERIKAKAHESHAEQEARERQMRAEFDEKMKTLALKEASMASLGSARCSSMSSLRRNSPRFQPGVTMSSLDGDLYGTTRAGTIAARENSRVPGIGEGIAQLPYGEWDGPAPRPLPPGCRVDHSEKVRKLREKNLRSRARVLQNQEALTMAREQAKLRMDEQIEEKERRFERRNDALEMRRAMRERHQQQLAATRREINEAALRDLTAAKENLRAAGEILTKGPVSLKTGLAGAVEQARAEAGFATYRGTTR